MLTESVAFVPDFTSYFSFSRLRSGYSGVATFCRTSSTPSQAQAGLVQADISPGAEQLKLEFSAEELKGLDSEGRCVMTRHRVEARGQTRHLVIINVYCPRADPEKPDRELYKLHFYKALDIRANSLRKAGDLVIVCGDVNTSHKQIDHCDPYEEFEDNPGRRFLTHFLKDQSSNSSVKSKSQCRDSGDTRDNWLAENVEVDEHQFVDTFRIFHPEREMAFTCWNTKMNCRVNNYGTRIDYILASLDLEASLSHCDIQPEVTGSDHCPVVAALAVRPLPASKPPDCCTKYFREFSGKQVKLSQFFTKAEKPAPIPTSHETKPPPAKRQKVENKTKITSFFMSQSNKPSTQQPSKLEEKENGTNKAEKKPVETVETVNNNAKTVWGNIFKPPPPPPLCIKHKEEAVKRKVTKKGPNTGREFWCCRKGEGRADDPEARCDYFKWA